MVSKRSLWAVALVALLSGVGCHGWCDRHYPCPGTTAAYPAGYPNQPCVPCVPCCPTPSAGGYAPPAGPPAPPPPSGWGAPRCCP